MSENKSIRIRTTPNSGDKFVKIKLEQDFSTLDILSLKISQEDIYKTFCADYGAVCGRVNVNSGFGVANCRVSIFIPISDEDKLDPEIKKLYPYEIITDKNVNGIRYNLFPQDSDINDNCFTPIGSFGSKREFLDNDILGDIFCKYYKFTTTTNHAGDFLFFGIPIGNYIVQVDTDISNIGIISQKAYDFIEKGTSTKNFESPNKFKSDKNLDKLIQVKTLRSGVNVKPFWGQNCEIGINRLDFDLQENVKTSAIFMGSIFTDSDKNSINKNCHPRKDLGRLCETIANEGTIEILRKNNDGDIEIAGVQRIDNDGTWSFQIPMDSGFVRTDESGNLIESDDPNIGIPTKTRVRFRISVDQTGGEGRLRTRGSYLVPNNPNTFSGSDFTFDETTQDTSFVDLYWNKIYSVKNFIPRFQPNAEPKNRNMVGIKDVDDCVGDKTPFPYNRIDTDLNPLYSVLCIIINLVIGIVAIINGVLIKSLNIFNSVLNVVLELICNVVHAFSVAICPVLAFLSKKITKQTCLEKACIGTPYNSGDDCTCSTIVPYIGCIVLACDNDNSTDIYAPGCNKQGSPQTGGVYVGFTAAQPPNIDHWAALLGTPNDGHAGHNVPGAGIADCYALKLAESLNVFEFDFYNDWINGTLYFPLLKYKKKKKGNEKLCEYDCGDFAGFIDGDNNGNPDNPCHTSFLVDNCHYSKLSKGISFGMRDGLVKKFDDELYYASYTHSGDKKLLATDVIHLGAVLDCDYQGIPKIQELLLPTSYQRPPLTSEFDENGLKLVCGMSSTGLNNNGDGLFFEINCLGLTVDNVQCENIKKQCEMGVGADENVDATPANCNIGPEEIVEPGETDSNGNFFRDVFYTLNHNGINVTTYPNTVIDTKFYSSGAGNQFLGPNQYFTFRGYESGSGYVQPRNNSYFFYFGLIPGKTALDKMNSKYFNKCERIVKKPFVILGNTTDVSTVGGFDGAISIAIVGGTPSFTFSWVGPNGFTSTAQSLTGLEAGTYTLTVTDGNGLTSTTTFIVNEPQNLFCDVEKLRDATTSISNDGQIRINGVGGGTPPYQYELVGPVTIAYTPLMSSSLIIGNLLTGNYIVNIKDADGTICSTTNIQIDAAPVLSLNVNSVNALCYGTATGSLSVNIGGGIPPYDIITSGASYFNVFINQPNLFAGTYITTVQDSIGQTLSASTIITQDAQMTINHTILNQCSTGVTYIDFSFTDPNTSGPWNIAVDVDGDFRSTISPTSVTGTSFTLAISGTEATQDYLIVVRNSRGCAITDLIDQSDTPRPVTQFSLSSTTQPNQCNTGTTTINYGIFDNIANAPFAISYSGDGIFISSTTISTIGLQTISTTYSATNYTIQAINSLGCVSNLTITGVTRPTIPLSLSSTTQPVQCSSTATTFTIGITDTINNSPFAAYYSGDGVSISSTTVTGTGLNSITTTYSATNYNIKVINSKGCVSNTLTTSGALTRPSADLSASTVSCGASPCLLTSTVSGGWGTYSYQWYRNNVPIGTTSTQSALISGNYYFNVTDISGCTTDSNTVVVT